MGHPVGRRGEEIPTLARIVSLAQTVEVFLTAEGLAFALQVTRRRRARWFDPDMSDLVLEWGSDKAWWDAITEEPDGMLCLAEPPDRVRSLDEHGLDAVAEAFAEIIDAKSPFTYKHSSRVADIAVGIARQLGLEHSDERQLYRASLLHDMGKLGVSNRILDKPGKLTAVEMREVRKHPIYTWEILSRVPAFQSFAAAAALHHERLDGSGYPWGVDSESLDLGSRIVAVADVFEALTSERSYRWGLPEETALESLMRGSGSTLDAMVVDALDSLLKNEVRRPALTIR